jgi:hypothetical protein
MHGELGNNMRFVGYFLNRRLVTGENATSDSE